MSVRSLLVAMSLVFAASNAIAANSAGYDRLLSWFENGTAFDLSGSLGWHSGRCWDPASDNAMPALLILDERETDGPAFPPVQKLFLLYQRGVVASLYDSLSDNDRSMIAGNFNLAWNGLPNLTGYESGFSQGWTNLRYSQAHDYLLVSVAPNLPGWDRVTCYFFARL